jgi:protein-S-isoprenylcysteine O-methyltransferase Ste14
MTTMMDEEANKRSKVPPPLIYLAGLVFSYLLSFIYHVALMPQLLSLVLGVVLLFCGFALSAWGANTFRMNHTSLNTTIAVSKIVTSGPFRTSRNPMYLGLAIIYLGVAFIANDLLVLLFLIPVFAVMNYYIIPREERYLEANFGEDYRAYKKKARRWL